MKKRILILGAGDAQLNLIKTAKELGYYTIVCDMRSEMKGAKIADKYYQQNYMEKETIYEIACKEKINGVISNSEPAMENVSYLVDSLNLPGNSIESLKKLLSKQKFRQMQRDINLYCPNSYTSSNSEKILEYSKILSYPIIIKPAESSGSRGIAQLKSYDKKKILKIFDNCIKFSRNKKVIIEEFIEMKNLYVFQADVFIFNDEFIWDGLFTTKRSERMPFVPMTHVFPVLETDSNIEKFKQSVEKILLRSGVKLGEFNVEGYITKKNEIFLIEINVRQGGNHIPKLIQMHTGISLTKLLVTLSVNDISYYNIQKTLTRDNSLIMLHMVFPDKAGIYNGIYISPELESEVIEVKEEIKIGNFAEKNNNAEDVLAYVFMKFENREKQCFYLKNIEKYIFPIIV